MAIGGEYDEYESQFTYIFELRRACVHGDSVIAYSATRSTREVKIFVPIWTEAVHGITIFDHSKKYSFVLSIDLNRRNSKCLLNDEVHLSSITLLEESSRLD